MADPTAPTFSMTITGTDPDKLTTSEALESAVQGVVDQVYDDFTGVNIKERYEEQPDTNAFTDDEKSKLSGVAADATSDQTGEQIKSAYEAEDDTNALTDDRADKLDALDDQATTTAALATKADAATVNAALDEKADSSTVSAELDLKAPLSSPALTGTPEAPTATPGTNTTQIATSAFVQAAIAALLESAPETLDTLNELAAALGDDPNFATTVTNTIATKLAKASNLSDLVSALEARGNLGLGEVDNTADLDKPVSDAAQLVFDVKADLLDEDEILEWPVAWQGSDGRVHGYIDHLGKMATGGFISLDVGDGLGEDRFAIEPLFTGANGDIRLGWDEVDGGLSFEVAAKTAGALIEKAGGVVALRTGQTAFMAHDVGVWRLGTVPQRGGFMAEVVERRNGNSPFAMVRSPDPVEICMTMGQSNAGTGGISGVNPRKLTGAPFENSVFGFVMMDGTRVMQNSSATSEADTSVLTDIISWQDSPSGAGLPQNQGGMIAFGLELSYRVKGALSPGIFCHIDWYGGQNIATFSKGQPTYENLIAHHARAADLAALYGRTVQATAVHYVQGESYSAGYEAALDTLCDDLRTDIVAATGQAEAPIILVAQINEAGDTTDPMDGIALEQLAVADSRPTEVKISAPMYQGRLTDQNIHLDAESRMMVGAAIGDAHRRLIDGTTWYTFQCTASRTAEVITLSYTTNGMDLEFDPGEGEAGDGWVKSVANYGFEYADDSSGETIASVEIGPNSGGRLTEIIITLSGDPGAATNKTLTYARNVAGEVADDDWAGARGMVRCRGPRCMFRDMGFNVPEFIWHYAVQQEVSV